MDNGEADYVVEHRREYMSL